MVQASDEFSIQQDLPQAFKLLDEMNNNVKQVSTLVQNMVQRVKSGEVSTEHGLDFLEIKYHMLIDYLINLTFIVLCKCSGYTIENDPSIDRLVEIRAVLEKIRPIDHKLRYQIDKLVKTAVAGVRNVADPLTFKPRPDNFSSGNIDESESSDNENSVGKNVNDSQKKDALYIPPRISAVHYDIEQSKDDKNKQILERSRKRMFTFSMLQDLKEEYLETPIEISSGSRAQQTMLNDIREKTEYEETYFTRLPVSKVEKHTRKRLTTLGTLGNEMTSFSDKVNTVSARNRSIGSRKTRTTMKKKHLKKRTRMH